EVPDTCCFWYDIRCQATISNRVMHTRAVRYMFTQIIYPDVHHFHTVECASASFRGSGSVSRLSFEVELDGDHGLCTCMHRGVPHHRMPGQCTVKVIEHACFCHMCFSAQHFFCRASVITNRTGKSIPFHYFFQRGYSFYSGSAQEVVSTSMSGTIWSHLCFRRSRGLGKTWQCIKFSKDANDRFSLSVFSYESCIEAADVIFNRKALALQFRLLKFTRIRLLVRRLWMLPNIARHLCIFFLILFEPFNYSIFAAYLYAHF